MKCRILVVVVVLALLAPAAWGAGERWLHIRVQEHDGDEGTVSVNVPLHLVEQFLPLIRTDDFQGGRIRIDDDEWDELDLRAVLEAVRDAPDTVFVTVRGPDENVRVAKENDFLVIRMEEDDERVQIRMPLTVVEALLSGERNELDVAAAVQALGEYTDGNLIEVDSDDSTVRIWVDSSETGE